MEESIIVAMITGACSVLAVIITNISANNKMAEAQKVAQAVTDTKLDALTDEVREHNNFAKRVPVLEEKVKNIEHRVDALEKK